MGHFPTDATLPARGVGDADGTHIVPAHIVPGLVVPADVLPAEVLPAQILPERAKTLPATWVSVVSYWHDYLTIIDMPDAGGPAAQEAS